MAWAQSRWWRAIIGTGTVLGAVSALGMFATPVAGAPSTSGKISVTGGTGGPWDLTNPVQCVISSSGPISIELYGTVVTNPVTNKLGGSFPELVIGQWKRNGPAHGVNLAKSKDYDINISVSPGGMWVSGWVWFGGTKFKQLGSGTLTMATNGKSGMISTEMVPYSAPPLPGEPPNPALKTGKIHVTATWGCA